MSRRNSPCTVGKYWLDKRRDGRAKDIWQIATNRNRTVVYRSTDTGSLDEAEAAIHAYVAAQRSLEKQTPTDAEVGPMLMNYWQEHARKLVNHDQAGRSIRTFLAFLMQDRVGGRAVVSDLTAALFERFREWRMGAHAFKLPWGDQMIDYSSGGVGGATVQRNINDIRAAVHYAEANQRITNAPKIKDLDRKFSSPPRERVLSVDEMARIAWYASHNVELFRFVVLQFGTAIRPTAALKFDPRKQYAAQTGLIDQHPEAAPQTKKRNAVIPTIRPLRPILEAWAREGSRPVDSHKTAWRVMRRTLGLSEDVFPKTIRHTIATHLYGDETVPERQVVEMLGHDGALSRTTRIYAKYSPTRMKQLVRSLERFWLVVSKESRAFGSVHCLTTGMRGDPFKVVAKAEKC